MIFALLAVAATFVYRAMHQEHVPEYVPGGTKRFDMPAKPVQPRVSSHQAPHATESLPREKAHPAAVAGKESALLAVVIDDMGAGLKDLDALTAIGVPLTFSVIPGLAKATQVAQTAHTRGYEVMIHLPMEPTEYPKRRVEANALLTAQNEAEISERMRSYFAQVPHAVGANNHMGSRFTERKDKMQPVIAALKEKGLFFIDSRTSPRSVAYSLARDLKVPAGTRSVFLDNAQDVAAIRTQLQAAAALARKKGGVVAICHPHPATIAALSAELPKLAGEGVSLVPASRIVR